MKKRAPLSIANNVALTTPGLTWRDERRDIARIALAYAVAVSFVVACFGGWAWIAG